LTAVGASVGRRAAGIEDSAKYTSKAAMITERLMKMNRRGSSREILVIADQYHQGLGYSQVLLRTVI
jgi:hypothetical protein